MACRGGQGAVFISQLRPSDIKVQGLGLGALDLPLPWPLVLCGLLWAPFSTPLGPIVLVMLGMTLQHF